MSDLAINDLASMGLISDIPGYQLPPEAFTYALNVRFDNDGVGPGPGWSSLFGTLSGAPYFVLAARQDAQTTWFLYASLTNVYATDQATHADITGTTIPAAGAAWSWNGTIFGSAPVVNDGANAPQYWSAFDLATKLADIPDWKTSLGTTAYAKVIRTFGPQLVAFAPYISNDPSGGGSPPGLLPHGIVWSHSADPGTMPSSWNYADETKDAGLTELPDGDAGVILDALPLRSSMVVYKQNSTWLMRRVGGQFIFQFDPLFVASGVLTTRAVCATGDGKYHVVVTQDDVILHDGNEARSIIDKRNRNALFNNIDVTNFRQTFAFAVPAKREVWICYPSAGSSVADRAFVWKYGTGGQDGIWAEQECPFAAASFGFIVPSSGSWDSFSPTTWDGMTIPWNIGASQRVVLADPADTKLFGLDTATSRDGAAFNATLSREGLPFLGRRRQTNDPILDQKQRKLWRRVWPKVDGSSVAIRVGQQDLLTGVTTWGPSTAFNPNTMRTVDVASSGVAPSIEFSWNTANSSKLYGYKVEIEVRGKF